MFLSSCLAHRLKKLSGLTKAQCFFSQDSLWREKCGCGRGREEFLGYENQIFPCQGVPARNYNDMERNWHNLVHFFEEFVHFGKNLYILGRQDRPEWGHFLIFSSSPDFSSPHNSLYRRGLGCTVTLDGFCRTVIRNGPERNGTVRLTERYSQKMNGTVKERNGFGGKTTGTGAKERLLTGLNG